MQQNNKSGGVGYLIFILILAGIVGGVLINNHFNEKEKSALADHAKKKIELSQKWQEELWQAYGEGDLLKGIANDPNLSILQMLKEISNRAVPSGSKVKVNVENFTEFDIHIIVYQQVDKESASKTVKSILAHCSDYVNSINFVYKNNIVKVIGKREIDKVKNWKAVRLSLIEKLFITP